MNCLCGKKMTLLLKETIPPTPGIARSIILGVKVWACPPDGCGRIYLEGSRAEIGGTWYTAEQNSESRSLL